MSFADGLLLVGALLMFVILPVGRVWYVTRESLRAMRDARARQRGEPDR